MTPPMKIPDVEVALADLTAAGRQLAEAIREHADAQFAADDMLSALINAKIGSPNDMTGRNHTYTSAEDWAKKQSSEWRDARRAVVHAEAFVEELRVAVERARLIARLAVLRTEQEVAI